jgi:hypothetical protein
MVGGRMGSVLKCSAMLAALTGLGGCASMVSGLYGSAATEEASATASASGPKVARVDIDPDAECPQINVPIGASSYASYAGEASPGNVRFQARIAQFARECVLNSDNTVTIRIGVDGLVILGEKGAPGTYPAPLQILIKDRDGQVVFSQASSRSVTIAPGQTQGTFRVIDDSAKVPISAHRPLRSYEIIIGFQTKGAAPTRRRG